MNVLTNILTTKVEELHFSDYQIVTDSLLSIVDYVDNRLADIESFSNADIKSLIKVISLIVERFGGTVVKDEES